MKAKWLELPEDHDYASAYDYLSLKAGDKSANEMVDLLRSAPVIQRKAKDILRASDLTALTKKNRHVKKDIHKIEDKTPLSPILLVAGNPKLNIPLLIADGFHRMCAAYLFDEDLQVHCKVIEYNW